MRLTVVYDDIDTVFEERFPPIIGRRRWHGLGWLSTSLNMSRWESMCSCMASR